MKQCLDGNSVVSNVAFQMSDMAFVYPITPSTPAASSFVAKAFDPKKKNVFGNNVVVRQMQSEAGVAGALHGALQAGALCTSFTSSQGLLLMLPVLPKMAGEGLPLVLHLAARSVSGNGVSIFCDHTDVNAIRDTGVALLSSHSVQEAADLSLVSHIAAITSSTPFVHFYEGFQISHELASVYPVSDDVIKSVVPHGAVREFRDRALSPSNPKAIGVVHGRETFWQQMESDNRRNMSVPKHVEHAMEIVSKASGHKKYSLFEYVGHPNAERVVVVMGAHAHTVETAARHLISKGEKVGVVKVHLYRPWSREHFLNVLPPSTKSIAVLDRTYTPMAVGEPMFLDVAASLTNARNCSVIGGRYAIGDFEFTPSMALSVFSELTKQRPLKRFAVGIKDDVTHLSLKPQKEEIPAEKGVTSCMFWGIGGDGTVSANRALANCISEASPDNMAQAVFHYDAHKTLGLTVSSLRYTNKGTPDEFPSYHGPIQENEAQFISINVPSYIEKHDILKYLREGGTVLLNYPDTNLPASFTNKLAEKKARLFVVDANAIAKECGLGNHTNLILSGAFMKISGLFKEDKSIVSELMKSVTFSDNTSEGKAEIVRKNKEAVEKSLSSIKEVTVVKTEETKSKSCVKDTIYEQVVKPVSSMDGKSISVKPLVEHGIHGLTPPGTSALEKRGIAEKIPVWDAEKCFECNKCAFVCPQSAIRPFVTDKGFRIQVSPLDCTSCGACVSVCPAKALSFTSKKEVKEAEAVKWDELTKAKSTCSSCKSGCSTGSCPKEFDPVPDVNVQKSQLRKPLLEFAGSCAGCPEPIYPKLLTQLFGDRLMIANGIGCSTVWGGTAFCNPYTVDKNGHGPSWGCSLFENTAEYGFGMTLASLNARKVFSENVAKLAECTQISQELRDSLKQWLECYKSKAYVPKTCIQKLVMSLYDHIITVSPKQEDSYANALRAVWENREHLQKRSHWIVGGDGWAHDIGFGGLDHILNSGEEVRVLVFDNENYANTGGQQSKATPRSAVVTFANDGKRGPKKDLGSFVLAMHPNAYVASVCYGANMEQTVKALREADAHKGPSVVVCYCPCMEHHPTGGFSGKAALDRMKLAVDSGYWPLYRKAPGKPIVHDSKKANPALLEKFLQSEGRFVALGRKVDRQTALALHKNLQADLKRRDTVIKALDCDF